MGVIRLGNGYYFLYIAIAAAYLVVLSLILYKRRRNTARIVFAAILFLNLALHFFKLAFPTYRNGLPASAVHITPENICAVSTLVFPFIYLIGKQNVLHDYTFFIGVVGGLAAIFYPTAIGAPPFAFETIRFYFCHINLFAVPMAAAIVGVYRPRLKKFWAIPLLFLAHEALICLNELFVVGIGLVDADFSDLLDPAFRNFGFAFGVRPDFAIASRLLDPLVPVFFKTDAFHINGGAPFHFPVLWLIVPAFVYLIPAYAVVSSPFWIRALMKRRAERRK